VDAKVKTYSNLLQGKEKIFVKKVEFRFNTFQI
jgi:hypothetical protein